MTLADASIYDSLKLNATSGGLASLYQRDASVPLNSTLADAANIGVLKWNETQLDVKGKISRQNANHFYKFALDGKSMKMNFTNNTNSSGLRVQIMNSAGKVIADSSSRATQALQDAYKDLTTSTGLGAKAGDYYVKVAFDTTSLRSVPQTYSLGLYSGTRFTASYQTTAKAQTSPKQTVLTDNTMTYSLIDAFEYENKATHIANEKPGDAVNIGWLYENKSALSVTSVLNSLGKNQFYSVTLQKGDNLKLAFNNHTKTSDIRVQLFDSTGTKILADSHGTDKQKENYDKLSSSSGLSSEKGPYLIKVSYAAGARQINQLYDFKLFSGTSYDALYSTKVGVESMDTALAAGHLVPNFSARSVTASYLSTVMEGGEINIMDEIGQYV